MKILIVLLSLMLGWVTCSSEKCSCIPAKMTFQIDTSGGCALKVKESKAISDSFCIIRESKYQKNLIPVYFEMIKIFKLNEDLYTTGTPTVIKGATDGDTIALSFDTSNSTTNNSILGGVQFMLSGKNSDGNSVTQDHILSFSNDCKSLVFTEGDQIGFLKVVSTTASCLSSYRIYCL